jgi:signal transduction histidine kinase
MNAINHGPADGEIRVLVEQRDGRALIAVEDDGPGIPESRTATAFDRGVRGEGSDGVPGAGLGLYIVRLIAEAHGGTVAIDHTSDTSRIVIDLPLAGGTPADTA